ncbi:MAG: sigma factor [Pseudomonadota bacterium]
MTESHSGLVEHFFRHESANLVSVLTRVFGFAHLQLVEDTVQSALVEALEHWKINGAPDNPAAWVHRVARNKALDALRRQKTETRIFEDLSELSTSAGQAAASGFEALFAPAGITDSVLRMMFACSHPSLDRLSQLALMLKLLCGFSDREIASALLIGPDAARKKVYRAKKQIADSGIPFEIPDEPELAERIGAVNVCLPACLPAC